MKCPTCSYEITDAASVSCPSCGNALEETYAETRKLSDAPVSEKLSGIHITEPPRATSSRSGSLHTSRPPNTFTSLDSVENARFVAGTMLGDRYRIVGLLGRGGMGEVYKAEDLRLGQVVALKFLPERLSEDGAALTRFHREVRVARQIAHRHVCRVYDIGEVEGLHFLSMEHVRGEELSSVIKRFGRLPHDKALDIARQLCAGLAAAHEAGILHRDLKPGNVMIDERGDVRIMDFGLAGLTEEFQSEHAVEGTPEYMSPEQFTGRELTPRSDIYSLGLILYELFTGKKAFKADSLPALIRLRRSETMPEMPSSLVRDLDPMVERVIERCLAVDPKDRPATALQVAAALPGGDPLAAALAAGETPSPEMVAAAHKEGSLRPAIAVAVAFAAVALFALALFLSGRVLLHNLVPLERSAQGLRERAAEVAESFGYADAPYTAGGFYYEGQYIKYIRERDQSPTRWERLRAGQPAVIGFWHRRSPRPLLPMNARNVEQGDPPHTVSGMTGLWFDTRGRLTGFYGVPPQVLEADDPARAPFDWGPQLAAAGLDAAQLKRAEPKWLPPQPFDEQVAWEGFYPAQPDMPIRVEGAAFRGKPVHFRVVNPWDIPTRQEQFRESVEQRVARGVLVALFALIVVGALFLARRNLRLGRGDRRGASRVAAFVFVAQMLSWLLMAPHVPLVNGEFLLLMTALAWAGLIAAIIWVGYIALEPFVRRRWPSRIISWNRLLAGDFRDPLVGRDLLLGALFSAALIVLSLVQNQLPQWLGWAASPPAAPPLTALSGSAQTVNMFIGQIVNAFVSPVAVLFLLLLFTIILRREWVGVAVLFVLMTLLSGLQSANSVFDFLFGAANNALTLFILIRFGLLTLVFTQFFILGFFFFPITTDFSAWYAAPTYLVIATALSLVAYGFHTSLGGQSLFKGALDD